MRGQLLPASCVVIKLCYHFGNQMEKLLNIKQGGQRNEKKTGIFLQYTSTKLV